MEVDTTQQQTNDPVSVLTRYVNQRSKPTAREQDEKHTSEELKVIARFAFRLEYLLKVRLQKAESQSLSQPCHASLQAIIYIRPIPSLGVFFHSTDVSCTASGSG
jgi:hypothetical protein